MRYLCDGKRHLICEPYSIEGLHAMARALGITRHWFHAGKLPHYDIPARRVAEIEAQCGRVAPRRIVEVIRSAQAEERLPL